MQENAQITWNEPPNQMPQKKVRKIKFQFKALAFILATLSLSLFFEGWRQVASNPSPDHLLVLLAGAVFTAIFVWIQAFSIYLEEKYKGSLKKQVLHFERMSDLLDKYSGKS